MDNFYVVLPSNIPSFSAHINTNVDFEAKLHAPLELEGSWEVGLTEIYLPPAHLKLVFRFYLLRRRHELGTKNYDSVRLLPIRLDYTTSDDGTVYIEALSPKSNTSYLHYNVDKTIASAEDRQFIDYAQALTYGREYQQFSRTSTFPCRQDGNKTFFSDMFDFRHPNPMSSASEDTIKLITKLNSYIANPTNTRQKLAAFKSLFTVYIDGRDGRHINENLIVPLPDMGDPVTKIVMRSIGIDIYKDLRQNEQGVQMVLEREKELDGDEIEVTLNVAQHTRMGLNAKRLLRIVKRKHTDKEEHITYKNIRYVPLTSNNIDTLHINMTTREGYPAHVYDKCMCVLHFRRKP